LSVRPDEVTYHVLGGRNELDHTVVELCPLPSISRLVLTLVPVEKLRNVVGESTHAALPPVASLDECDIRVDVGPAAPASRDARVLDDGHWVITERLAHTAVGCENESEGKLALAQHALGLGHGVERAALVRGVRVDVRRLCNGCLLVSGGMVMTHV
jgi:hypothetical protein